MKLGVAVSSFPTKFGPIVFSGPDLAGNLRTIKGLGYDGIDLFMHPFSQAELDKLTATVQELGLEVCLAAAIFLAERGVNLSDPDPGKRIRSVQEFKTQIEVAAKLGANMPIGFLRGLRLDDETETSYRKRLAESMKELSEYGAERGVSLLLEPMNRYEINTMNRVDQSLEFIEEYRLDAMGLLIDTFHMNIEDPSIEEAIKLAAHRTVHIHIPDSNRLAPGAGHLDYDSIIKTIVATGYDRYLTIEALPLPSSLECAESGRDFLEAKLREIGVGRQGGMKP